MEVSHRLCKLLMGLASRMLGLFLRRGFLLRVLVGLLASDVL